MKHAFLIIAHNEFRLLKALVQLLDHPNNDIYIHIDLKADNSQYNFIYQCVDFSHLEIFCKYAVSWGDESQVNCELFLIKKAVNKKYDYYHILSGTDLPIKSMKYIHDFFDIYYGKEFIHFDNKIISNDAKLYILCSRKHYAST